MTIVVFDSSKFYRSVPGRGLFPPPKFPPNLCRFQLRLATNIQIRNSIGCRKNRTASDFCAWGRADDDEMKSTNKRECVHDKGVVFFFVLFERYVAVCVCVCAWKVCKHLRHCVCSQQVTYDAASIFPFNTFVSITLYLHISISI